jgi:anti-anti-sigma factor
MADNTKINVQAEQTPRGLVVRVTGVAGVDQVDELDREFHVLTALRPKFVVLDMSGVPYISSMALGALLRFRHEIADAGGRVAVAGLSRQVGESFRLAGLGKVLAIHETVDEALDGTVH